MIDKYPDITDAAEDLWRRARQSDSVLRDTHGHESVFSESIVFGFSTLSRLAKDQWRLDIFDPDNSYSLPIRENLSEKDARGLEQLLMESEPSSLERVLNTVRPSVIREIGSPEHIAVHESLVQAWRNAIKEESKRGVAFLKHEGGIWNMRGKSFFDSSPIDMEIEENANDTTFIFKIQLQGYTIQYLRFDFKY